MSAESPRRGSKPAGHVVRPQSVSDKSFIESVAGFINEVVPQAYTGLPHSESRESILWARFEYTDINDPALCPDGGEANENTPPLLLALGYTSGVQVWAIPASGEAQEVLSWRQGVVRILRLLPSPESLFGSQDSYSQKRPLVALCDGSGTGPQFCSLNFVSLRTGEQVRSIKFQKPLCDVVCTRRALAVTFPERIAVFDACTLEDRFSVSACFPSPGPNPNPVALGSRWLAYADARLMAGQRSSGGAEVSGQHSYTATVIHAAKSLTKGLKELGESVASSLTGRQGGGGGGIQMNPNVPQPGVVTVMDIHAVGRGESISGEDLEGVMAHFLAHPNQAVVAMAFDPSGSLLLTADRQGHDFHLFRVHPHPLGAGGAAVHHLYILHRGDTTARVQDITFSLDSRWVAVSTLRGTTHIFPVTPYGGAVGVRTHTSHRVVNRLSRFHRSAGLDEGLLPSSGRNSPVMATPNHQAQGSGANIASLIPLPPPLATMDSPHAPLPYPTLLRPLAQLRQPILMLSGTGSGCGLVSMGANPSPHRGSPPVIKHRSSSAPSASSSSSSANMEEGGAHVMRVAAVFAAPRAWLSGSPGGPRSGGGGGGSQRRAVDALFIMATHGSLVEYALDPRPASGIQKEKMSEESPIELEVVARAQWNLLRPSFPSTPELQPPLPSSNPLMLLPPAFSTPSRNSLSEDSAVDESDADERWLSQVEIVTHAGPHRRLWMGPQFSFKTYHPSSSQSDGDGIEVNSGRLARSNPVNMPVSCGSVVPVLIEAGSGSSFEQSPRLVEVYGDHADSDGSGVGTEVETQLRENLADAMMESPGVPFRDTARAKRECEKGTWFWRSEEDEFSQLVGREMDLPSSPPSFRVMVGSVRKAPSPRSSLPPSSRSAHSRESSPWRKKKQPGFEEVAKSQPKEVEEEEEEAMAVGRRNDGEDESPTEKNSPIALEESRGGEEAHKSMEETVPQQRKGRKGKKKK